MSWTPPLRELIKDQAVLETFDSIAKYLSRIASTDVPVETVPTTVPPVIPVDPNITVAPLQFPPDFQWFSSGVQDGISAESANEVPPTFGTSGTQTSYNDTNGFGRTLTTGAVSGNGAGVIGGASGRVTGQMDITWTKLVRMGADIAAMRVWSLFTNTAVSDSDDIGGISEYMGFRYSTVAGDAGWVGVCRDGTTQSVSAVVGTIAANTTYKLRMRKSGGVLYFSVNNGSEVSLSTNLPGATTELFWSISWWTKSALARAMTWYRHWVRFGIYTPPAATTLPLPTAPPAVPPATPPIFDPTQHGARWSLYKSSSQVISAGVVTPITWQTKVLDTSDAFAGGSRIVIRSPGFYRLSAQIASATSNSGAVVIMTVNGVIINSSSVGIINTTYTFNGGEVVECSVSTPYGLTILATTATFFQGDQP